MSIAAYVALWNMSGTFIALNVSKFDITSLDIIESSVAVVFCN